MEEDRKYTQLFDNDGKIARWPSKRKYQLMLINHMATKVPADKDFIEREVNEIIKAEITIDDFVLFRREMIEQKVLNRTADGKTYRKNPDFKEIVVE
ncbi:MAG: DUF2087 domain-containing protein [Candidatus Delongbacteria bacterium]|nr:DUF2087 domain-containing protein [Candidatus Delongbacteria bacterium]MBN2835297.1 DUF2087 domain-containing protein [Candidatus Delongbacteria bacterium]